MIQMPVNKKEKLIYTFLMVMAMASVMTVYNMAVHDGLSLNTIKKAWMVFPITATIAFLVEWFFVSKVAFFLIQKFVKADDALPKKILISALCFVTQMVIIMSVICAALFSKFNKDWLSGLLITIPQNFLMAYPLQVLIAGPLVGVLFRKMFPLGTIVEIKA